MSKRRKRNKPKIVEQPGLTSVSDDCTMPRMTTPRKQGGSGPHDSTPNRLRTRETQARKAIDDETRN